LSNRIPRCTAPYSPSCPAEIGPANRTTKCSNTGCHQCSTSTTQQTSAYVT